jgi:hypothetical protein
MRISVEKASDGTFIIEVPAKKKKGKKGEDICYREDIKYTAKNVDEALKVIKEALNEVETPDDEYGIAFGEAAKE